MSKVRVAIIGLGRIASLLEDDKKREKPATHAGAISSNKNALLVGGYDIDKERAIIFSKRWNCETNFLSAKEMLNKLKPEIVHICTHPDTHYKYVKLCVENNIKTVVCEKPLSDTLENAKKIFELSKLGTTKIMVNHERRYSNNYIDTKKIIDSKKYGEMLSIYAKIYFGRTRKLKDILLDDGTHIIDIINFLTNGYIELSNKNINLTDNTSTCFLVGKSNNIEIILEAGNKRNYLQFELDLSFETGRIIIGNGVYKEYKSVKSPYYEGFNSLTEVSSNEKYAKTDYFKNMVSDAIAITKNEKQKAVSSVNDAYEVMKFLKAIKSINK